MVPNTLKCNPIDLCIDIEDLGVTLRTLLAVGATGYKETGRRRWGIRYKGAVIGNIQVASLRTPARMTADASRAAKAKHNSVVRPDATLHSTLKRV